MGGDGRGRGRHHHKKIYRQEAAELETLSSAPLPFSNLRCPAFYAVSPAAHLNAFYFDTVHARCVVQPQVRCHAAGISTLLGDKLEERK